MAKMHGMLWSARAGIEDEKDEKDETDEKDEKVAAAVDAGHAWPLC